jgi:histidyl-tRNA synthetase
MQCDFDIVGSDTTTADFEILLLMAKSMQALGISQFEVRVSHRGIFNRVLSRLGLADRSVEILRTVDKIAKVGRDKVQQMLSPLAGEDGTQSILNFISPGKSSDETLKRMAEEAGGDGEDVGRLSEIMDLVRTTGLDEVIQIDPSITRGLDYYTGVVCETFLKDSPKLGSVCSGGRYNNLTSLYAKESMPGVGSSIGLDRLLAAIQERGTSEEAQAHRAVLILLMDTAFLGYYFELASRFQEAGIQAEVYPEKRRLSRQFQYAEQKGIPLAIICGEDERSRDRVILKDLISRESYEDLTVEAAIEKTASFVTSGPRK